MDITQVLTFAVDNGAEAVLISAGSSPVLRKGNRLVPTKMDSLSADETHRLICSALDAARLEQLEKEREVHFIHQMRQDCQCLASVCFERGRISAEFKMVPAAAPLPTRLGLPSFLGEAALASRGLLVVAAPPGHGKSTTLTSLVELINTEREAVVLTIEERILHPHTNKRSVIHQREIGRDTPSTRRALEAAAHRDPDVLVVDPMKDSETIRRTIAFAGRGHLVIASLEADDVPKAMDELVLLSETGKPDEKLCRQLASVLLLVAAVRLLPRKDDPGRIAATELLKVDASTARLIRDGNGEVIRKLLKDSAQTAVWSMDSFILKLHERGLVDDETARRYLLNPGALEA